MHEAAETLHSSSREESDSVWLSDAMTVLYTTAEKPNKRPQTHRIDPYLIPDYERRKLKAFKL